MRSKILYILLYLVILFSLIINYHNLSKEYTKAINALKEYSNSSNYSQTFKTLTENRQTLINKFNEVLIDSELSMDNIIGYENTINKEYELLKTKNTKLTEEKNALQNQKKTLEVKYNTLVKKYTYKIDNIKTINQYSEGYPTGCESAALTILLNYHNIFVTMDDVVNKLKKGKKPYYENGTLYGANPYIEFVGNPKDSGSYGTYEQAIMEVANFYKPGIINGTGKSLNKILEIVEDGRPVIVWNSMNLAVPYVSRTWIHKASGKKIKWIANEHALVIIGFNQNQVIVSDSLNGKIKYFDRTTFESRYNAYGKRALYY